MKNNKSLIVSDYDGTLKRDDNVSELQYCIELIKKIIEDETFFLVSTGRLLPSIYKEIEIHDIPYNFLSCGNGNVLFDEKMNVLYKTTINKKIIFDLKDYYKNILEIDARDEYGNKTVKDALEYIFQLERNDEVKREFIRFLRKEKIYDYCSDGQDKFKIHVFANTGKEKTIEECNKILQIDKKNIYTVGDGINDIEMIKKFNGFIIGNKLKNDEKYALEVYQTMVEFLENYKNKKIKKRGPC